MTSSQVYDVIIIGGGIAGLSTALRLPQSMQVALLTKGAFGESNTRYAQGGLAVALGADDSPALHFQDTIAAGAGLCDEQAVRILVEQAPAAVRWLMHTGVEFDRADPDVENTNHITEDGLLLGREAAHSRWRVIHAGGDATGAAIEQGLMDAVRQHPSITLYEHTFVQELLVDDGLCRGVQALDQDGHLFSLASPRIVLASGGAGSLWLRTSNPSGATADGLALAWHAGAALANLEFMQFHPTILVADNASHLVSEAVRGEGAYLRNHAGERFMLRYHPQAELAPRDIVARAILQEMLTEERDYQYLDLSHLPAQQIYARFPTISAACRHYGLDLAHTLLPVAPAAHYCMGGVLVDTYSRTTLPGLYAVGEVACTGVHGANRLASNSILEGLVFGLRLADSLLDCPPGNQEPFSHHMTSCSLNNLAREDANNSLPTHAEASQAITSRKTHRGTVLQDVRHELQQVMWRYVSLCRDQAGLLEAKQCVQDLSRLMASHTSYDRLPHDESGSYRNGVAPLAGARGGADTKSRDETARTSNVSLRSIQEMETMNMLQVADIVITAALQRHESRGSHWRYDYPHTDETLAGRCFTFQHEPNARSHNLFVNSEEVRI